MLIPRWRNFLCLNHNSLIPKISSSPAIKHHELFHSTCVLSEKRKKQWNSNGEIPNHERPSKNQIRYTVRQKRADAKKALNHILFHSGGIRKALQDEWNFDSPKQEKPRKKSKPGQGKKPRDKKTKRWHRKGNLSDDYDCDDNFGATCAKRVNSWSFKNGSFPRNPDWSWTNQKRTGWDDESGFEWREGWSWTNQKTKDWDDESSSVGSRSDRTILGLPLSGPLKIEDVKKAFKAAAFKWHPDKNQGPSQATAQEKFKLCLAAYNSLCSAMGQRL